MNPYIFPLECNVCGGRGVGTGRSMAAAWYSGFIYHTDPRVCAMIIQEKLAKHEEKKDEEK